LLIRGAHVLPASAAITRLHIVSDRLPDNRPHGLHGDVFAIGGSFFGREAAAFFGGST